MCLDVDYDKEIDDAKEYVFYKIYEQDSKYNYKKHKWEVVSDILYSPYRQTKVTGNNLIAKTKKGGHLPEDGQKAYDKYAKEEYWGQDMGANWLAGTISEGIHAFVHKHSATEKRDNNMTSLPKIIVKVRVKGQHIIAFGKWGDVVFTRGIIERY